MRVVVKAAQAAACLAILVAGAVSPAQADPAAAPAQEAPAKAVRKLNRAMLSINLPSMRTNAKPGSPGVAMDVNHTTDRGWYATVAQGNPRSPAASNGVAVVGSGHGREVWGYNLDDGKRRWMARSDDSGISSIVISGDSAYFTTYSCTLERVQVTTGVHKFRKWISPTVECAPDVAGDLAYASYRGGRNYMISAHNTSGGSESWKVEAPGSVIYAPVVSDNRLYVATTDGRLAGFDAASGKQQWSREAGAVGAPVMSNFGLLVVTARVQPEDKAAQAEKPADAAKPEAAAPAPKAGVKDDRKTESKPAPAPVPKSPEQYAPDPKEVGQTLAAVGDRRLALVSSAPQADGGLRLSGPTASGMDFAGARPGVDGNLAVFAMGNRVMALDLATSELRWELEVETRNGVFCQPAFGDGMVFLADNYGFITALERDTGNLVWSYKAEGESFNCTPAVSNNRVVLTTNRGLMLCLPTGTKQAKRDHKPADAFKKAVVASGGVKPANDVADPRVKQPTAQRNTVEPTPIEPGVSGTQPEPIAPPRAEAEAEADPFEGLPEDKRVGPGGIAPPKAGPGGIAPKEDPPSALPNPFEKKK